MKFFFYIIIFLTRIPAYYEIDPFLIACVCSCYSRVPEAFAQREESQETRAGSAGTGTETKSSAGRHDQGGRCAGRRASRVNRYGCVIRTMRVQYCEIISYICFCIVKIRKREIATKRRENKIWFRTISVCPYDTVVSALPFSLYTPRCLRARIKFRRLKRTRAFQRNDVVVPFVDDRGIRFVG